MHARVCACVDREEEGVQRKFVAVYHIIYVRVKCVTSFVIVCGFFFMCV